MKKIIPEFEFTEEDEAKIKLLAGALDVSEITARILFSRNIRDEQSARDFLSPSEAHFLSPFCMSGMEEACALLKQARDEAWRVAIFGDYDADGIGAVAILSRAFKEFGIEPYLFVPERADGYGLTVRSIDRIFDEFLPDLIVTVDCGISCKDEVEYIKESGASVIVTDHHELPAVLPDCIIINPKLKDDYPYDNLAGAGVAFKLACALIGKRAYDYLDFCALSTVADSVPLLHENRDIVAEGLKRMKSSPRAVFRAFLGEDFQSDTQTLIFTLAPRVNAAGRMGDAASALRLFTTEDEEELKELVLKLNGYNAERQRLCDETTAEADRLIREKERLSRAIVAADDWGRGLIGIAAARIAEEYSRPAILFSRCGELCHGSARSVDGVNVFEALSACSRYIENFGGHGQAAGVSVRTENLEAFERALDDYLEAHYPPEAFEPKIAIAGELDGDFERVARELELLEPFGTGNSRPKFSYRAGRLKVTPMRADSPHAFVQDGERRFLYFGGMKYKKILESAPQKTLIFECDMNSFRGKKSVRCLIRSFYYDAKDCALTGDAALAESLMSCARRGGCVPNRLTPSQTHTLVGEILARGEFGACFVATDPETVNEFPEIPLPVEFYETAASTAHNVFLLSPDADADLTAYRDVVFLDEPLSFPKLNREQRVYCNYGRDAASRLAPLKANRQIFSEIYVSLRNRAGEVRGETPADAAESCNALGYCRGEFIFALCVFSELGFIRLTADGVTFADGVKRSLNESSIFGVVSRITGS